MGKYGYIPRSSQIDSRYFTIRQGMYRPDIFSEPAKRQIMQKCIHITPARNSRMQPNTSNNVHESRHLVSPSGGKLRRIEL